MSRRLLLSLIALSVVLLHQPQADAAPDAVLGSVQPAATVRYFGRGPWDAVRTAAHNATRSCSISDDGLTALILAPVFKESSAATTPSTAPAPMTLSRYDEWNGTKGTSTPSSNYGLYAFRDPSTVYQRAFWSPGIGIWQYDSAGLGAPFTTVEAMNAATVAGDVARITASRYCGAAAGTSDIDRRYAAWRDWGYPCQLCEGFFQEMMSTTPRFANLSLVDGINPLGGVVQRTCSLAGVSGTLPCWYVDPRVGVIQGSTAWATFQPDGGTNTQPPTPLPMPFYVVDRGATEERHWLRADTGYGIDIKAARTIGKNARPSTQSGSGLTWSSSSGLCDLTAGRGVCAPVPPAGMTAATITVGSGFRPVALDANGDGKGDILWYRPGSGSDALWLGTGAGAFTSQAVAVSSTYDVVKPLDVDGDGDDDVLWYSTSTGASYLWRSNGNGTFTSITLSPGKSRIPLVANLDGGADDELVWYGPGATADAVWSWTGTAFAVQAMSVSGSYAPFVGDFDGNGRDDLFWYAPGAAADSVWLYRTTGGFTNLSVAASGAQQPVVGDYDGDHADDVMWYAAGAAADAVWWGKATGGFTVGAASVNGTFHPFVARLTAADRDQIMWYAPGAASDAMWTWTSSRGLGSTAAYLPSSHVAVPGAFSAGGYSGVVWYDPGAPPDSVWYR